MPYWDYTFDAYYYNATGVCSQDCLGADWEASEIFDDDWFGPMANASTGYVVASGRWAHTTIPTDARSSSPIVNAYGYLRSPWNQNPAPFLSRSRTIFGVENTATFSVERRESFFA